MRSTLFFCHKFDIEKHPNYVYLEDSNSNYAYLIDDLHTEKMPNQKELHIDTIQPNEIKESEWREEEPMITDVEVPDDELDPETEMAEQAENTDTVFITEKATDERTASQKYFDINDDLEDVDELPDDIVPYDMAALEVITEESLKAMDLF